MIVVLACCDKVSQRTSCPHTRSNKGNVHLHGCHHVRPQSKENDKALASVVTVVNRHAVTFVLFHVGSWKL